MVLGRFGLPGNGVHRRGHGAPLRQGWANGAERDGKGGCR